MARMISTGDLADGAAVRRMAGRVLRADGKPVQRSALLRWRREAGFPAPLETRYVADELWSRSEVRAWIQAQAFIIPVGGGRPILLERDPQQGN